MDETALQPVIDRFYGVCLGVAAALVDEDVASIEDTDRGAKIGLRWIMGPFEIMNRIGIDKTHSAVAAITEIYPDFKMPQILEKQKAIRILDLTHNNNRLNKIPMYLYPDNSNPYLYQSVLFPE